MIKNLNIILASALVLLCAVGCRKEDEAGRGGSGLGDEETSGLRVSIEQTKTGLTPTDYVCWKETDKVNVNGTALTVVPLGENSTSALLSGSVAANASGPRFCGFYPDASWWTVADKTVTLPATRTYNPASPLDNLPMYAESDNEHLVFRSVCGLMEFTLTGIVTVSSIKLSCATGNLTGTFSINSTGSLTAVSGTEGKSVTLNCPTGGIKLVATVGTKFYIAVPEGDYTNLVITITMSDGYSFRKLVASTRVNRGGLYASSLTPSPECVQLWADGPYWGLTDVGSTDINKGGDWYMWGQTAVPYTDKTNPKETFASTPPASEASKYVGTWTPAKGYVWCNVPYSHTNVSTGTVGQYLTKYVKSSDAASYSYDGTYDNKTTLEAVDDVATVKLGNKWRMPDASEVQGLLDKCYSEVAASPDGSNTGIYVYKVTNSADAGIYHGTNYYVRSGANLTTTTRRPAGTYSHAAGSTNQWIFLPWNGYISDRDFYPVGTDNGNHYFAWSRTLGGSSYTGCNVNWTPISIISMQNCGRNYAFCVRPVAAD